MKSFTKARHCSGIVQKRSNLSANRAPEWTVRLYGEWGSGDLRSKNEFLHNSRGFTLIEVLVASLILSSVFFAILKLIANNTYQATNLEHSKTMDSLFLSSKSCLQSFGYNALSGATNITSLNFGSDNMGCFTGSYDPSLSFTGITLTKQSNGELTSTTYWDTFRAENNSGTLRIYNTLSDGTLQKDYSFLVGK